MSYVLFTSVTVHGRLIKKIFKEAEVRFDWEVYGILDFRFDSADMWGYRVKPQYIRISQAEQVAKEAEMAIIREQEENKTALEEKREQTDNEDEIEDIDSQIEALNQSLRRAYFNADLEPSVEYWDDLITEESEDDYGDFYYENSENSLRPDVSAKTLGYLKRRSQRTMRTLAKDFPEAFTSAGAEMMMYGWTWTSRFIQAQEHLWKRDQRSLMKIVEQSQSEEILIGHIVF